MNPFFFGPSVRPLFGVYTHAKAGSGQPWSVLLCYPMGSEYMRAHRAFRQMNALLNRAGANVLRFDYSCTGDSAGEGVDASLDAWLDDIDWAMDELKDNAQAESITVVGLRMGATLASLACKKREDVDHLILWDPIVSGKTYLDTAVGSPRPSHVVGVDGFPLTPDLCRSLEGVDLREAGAMPTHVDVSILCSEDAPAFRELGTHRGDTGSSVHFEVVHSSGNWAQADPFGDALIPQEIIHAIVDRLKNHAMS